MKECEFYKLTVQEYILDDGSIMRRVMTDNDKKGSRENSTITERMRYRSIRHGLGFAAAVLLIVATMVAAIPEARAEVLSWFGYIRPEEYLTANPDERESNQDMDTLITTAEPNNTDVHVTYVSEDPLWQDVAGNFAVKLGDTLYDGKNIYQVIDFTGISGIGVYENEWSGEFETGTPVPGLTLEPLDGDKVRYFHEDNADTSLFMSGEMTFLMGTSNLIRMELPDGTSLWGWVNMEPRPEDIDFFQRTGRNEYGQPWENLPETKEAADEWNRETMTYLKAHGLRAVATFHLDAEMEQEAFNRALENAGPDGLLKAQISYDVIHDLGDTDETKFSAVLGTAQVDLKAYRDLPERRVTAEQEEVQWHGQVMFTSFDWKEHEYCISRYRLDTEGLVMHPGSGTVNVFGIHNLTISVEFPNSWSEEECEAFVHSVNWQTEIDGEREKVGGGSIRWRRTDTGYLITLNMREIPFDTAKKMRMIRLIPVISDDPRVEIRKTQPVGNNASETVLRELTLQPGETLSSDKLEPNTYFASRTEEIQVPDFAILFRVE